METPVPRVRRRGIGGFFEALLEVRGLEHAAERPADEYKQATRRHWTGMPCGTDVSDAVRHSREYFEDIERYRYRTQPWTAEAIDGFELQGRRVLEIGFGAGTDHLRLARKGGWLVGVDLTPRNFVETARRFELDGRRARLTVADMESLPFRDRAFDQVYSLGVVHHTPDVRRTVREQLSKVDHRYRRPTVVDDPGDRGRRPRDRAQIDERQDYGDLSNVERVTVAVELHEEKQHRQTFPTG